ncbi:hypothetical protein CONPUDRAFT_56293 [Coniophora puteana RWD-64-598 SS2]|uniref:DNA damage-binding protein 1 n=1 Tax=Coniophora puteana (strain RWD-64-598) TaxID=741705 RepID=A0A5M3MRK2_CONPW|nr:uncharacterized protein CONPUDRAFT_56293 [Coniophora puteana RWD-64-598 SS2]EIW81285.1 hypothetical protein CONPUDRAFT_56293 [Coniophora puteana RWD-64-598 SS2]
MKVVTTFHPSSSVLASCKWQLLDDARSEFLVIAKLNQLDIYSLQPEGLKYEDGLEIWGRVRAVRVVPIKKSTEMHLLVLTDHPEPELVFITYTTHTSRKNELRITKKLSLAERTGRIAEFFVDLLVDPTGQLAIVSTYAGKLKVVQLDDGEYDSDFDVSTTELNLLSLATILPSPDDLTVALLHVDYQQRLQLLTRDLSLKELQLSPLPSAVLPSVPLAAKHFSVDEEVPKLIHVPISEKDEESFAGGVLVIGGSKIFLYDLAPAEKQRKQKEKQRRTQKKKASADSDEVMKDEGKEKKKKARASVEWPWAEVSAWCQVDDVGRRFLLGDKFGRLVMLCVDISSNSSLTLIALGETSPATTLTYLSNQVVYLGSHYGDSQLLQISPSRLSDSDTPTLPVPGDIHTVTHIPHSSPGSDYDRRHRGFIVNGRGSHLTEVDRFQNIAPIYDAALVDPDNSGQYEVVTCSGGQNTGSIRLVRSGADFQEAAAIGGIPNITNIWPVRSLYSDPIHTHIVASTPQETYVFRIDNKHTVSHVADSGFVTGKKRTLVVQNLQKKVPKEAGQGLTYMDSSLVLQVTSDELVLLNLDKGLGEFTRVGDGVCKMGQLAGGKPGWIDREIVAASANASQVVLGLSFGRLAVVNFADNKFKLVGYRDFTNPSGGIAEISAVSCTPADQSKSFSPMAAVAFWQTHRVEIISLGSPFPTLCASVSLPSLPRSLLMHRFAGESANAPPHLLVGRADGVVATFVLKDKALVEQKQIPVGNLPVTFHTCKAKGRTAVFACGSRTSVLFWEKDRLRHSPLILKEVAAAASLHTHDYRSSLVLATSEGLVIGDVQNLEKLHIRSIHTGLDNPRRISHSPVHKALAVGCVRHTPVRVGEPEISRGSVQLYNDTTLDKLGQVVLDHDEEPMAIKALSVRVAEEAKDCFVVGTVIIDSLENESSSGRLLLVEPDYSRGESFVAVSASEKVKGCVYAVAAVDGLVVAAVNSAVVIYSIEADDHTRALSFVKKVEWNHNYVVANLVSRGNLLLVGDAISSVTLLQYERGALQNVARDYSPLWPTSVEMLDERNVIGADNDCNLFMFTLQDGAERKVLERNGHYYFGDMVNKFIPGEIYRALSSFEASDIEVEPKQLFFTTTGSIGVVIDMSDELSLHMSSLQRNLSTYFAAQPGGASHTKYRAPKNARGRSDADNSSFGFLDGDLLERFLLFGDDEEAVRKVLEGSTEAEQLSIAPERIIKVLERLQSMH